MEYKKVRREIEEYQRKHYPKLSHSYVRSRDAGKKKNEQENEQDKGRRYKQTEKEKVQDQAHKCLIDSTSLEEIDKNLRTNNLQPYYRGDVLQGVIVNDRKYRLTTLVKDNEELKRSIQTLQSNLRERLKKKGLER